MTIIGRVLDEYWTTSIGRVLDEYWTRISRVVVDQYWTSIGGVLVAALRRNAGLGLDKDFLSILL